MPSRRKSNHIEAGADRHRRRGQYEAAVHLFRHRYHTLARNRGQGQVGRIRIGEQELRRLAGKAIHVHISDCDGKKHGDLPPGRGVVEFLPYLREIKALGIEGSISIELEYSPEPDKIEAWVAEAYRETDRLMQAVGLRT